MIVQVDVADPSIALADDGYPFLAYLIVEKKYQKPVWAFAGYILQKSNAISNNIDKLTLY